MNDYNVKVGTECETCSKFTVAINRIEEHMVRHGELINPDCWLCNTSLPKQLSNLDTHRKTHGYQCPICNKTLKTEYYFRCHLIIHSGKGKP